VTAILEREVDDALAGERVGPASQALVALLGCRDGELVQEFSPGPVDGGGGVGALVGVDSDRDHLLRASYARRV
jgi:hypothetical protein